MTNGSSRSPELQKLLKAIRLLELELQVFLVVIHVPGVVMIIQRTDGLSRGIWFSSLHQSLSQNEITGAVFAPLPRDNQLVHQIIQEFDLPQDWFYFDWKDPWRAEALFDRFTV